MRTIAYLSPTSISKYYENKTEFYLNYLADQRPPKIPQTQPMAVGSSLDAYAKSFLHEKLFGKGKDPKFDFTTLFEAQVESHNRDFALVAGKHTFEVYKNSGALTDLMLDLHNAIGTPTFEFEVRGVVNGQREGVTIDVDNVTFLGKPDCFYINKMGAHVILDWKVNGYCSAYNVSPMAGYVRLRDSGRPTKAHKDAFVMAHKGVMINVSTTLEKHNGDWARQLSIYAWLCGEDIGSDFVAAIDQFACKPGTDKPSIRVAEHRLKISRDFQWSVFRQAQEIWQVCHAPADKFHYFNDLSFEDSRDRCKALDGQAQALIGDGSAEDAWFAQATRS